MSSKRILGITLFLLAAPMLADPVLAQDSKPAEAPKARQWFTLPENFGWLSPPDQAATTLGDALAGGKILFRDKLRYEHADASGSRPSSAFTNRYRVGYRTKRYHGVRAIFEVESVQAINGTDNWFVPATGQGDPSRTVIPDPEGFEINRWGVDHLYEGDFSLQSTAGRQRVIHDQARFIGNVGWRQFEQTFDAMRFESDLGQEALHFEYAYVWYVQRIFGDEGPNWNSSSHLVRAQYDLAPELSLIGFMYLLDFGSDSPANSVNTYGVRAQGSLAFEDDLALDYTGTFAWQTDAGDNTTSFEAPYGAGDAKIGKKGLGALGAGIEFIGSDKGVASFRFPLGTNHAFNGWADAFLTPPPEGLQDIYGYLNVDLPWKVKGRVIVHGFWTDEGSDDLGSEVDWQLNRKISPNMTVLAKAGFLNGKGGTPDITRYWVQTEFSF